MPPRRIILSSHGASLFGGERVLLALAETLQRHGDTVTLEVPYEGDLAVAGRLVPGLEVWVSGRPRLPRTVGEGVAWVAGAPGATWRLVRGFRSRTADVVWINTVFNPVAAIAARLAGVPVRVWQAHERLPDGPLGAALAFLMARCATDRVTVSRYMADSFAARGLGLDILQNAELRAWAPLPLPGTGPFCVGYLGQFEPRKRVNDLLGALALCPTLRAILIGDGKGQDSTRVYAQHAGLEARIHFSGFVQDPRPFLAQCHAMALTPQDEPFGLVALEAMALGRPIVAARSGAFPEVLGDAALYYEPGDVAQLARHLTALSTDGALYADLVTRGAARRALFTRHVWEERALDLLERACHRVVP